MSKLMAQPGTYSLLPRMDFRESPGHSLTRLCIARAVTRLFYSPADLTNPGTVTALARAYSRSA